MRAQSSIQKRAVLELETLEDRCVPTSLNFTKIKLTATMMAAGRSSYQPLSLASFPFGVGRGISAPTGSSLSKMLMLPAPAPAGDPAGDDQQHDGPFGSDDRTAETGGTGGTAEPLSQKLYVGNLASSKWDKALVAVAFRASQQTGDQHGQCGWDDSGSGATPGRMPSPSSPVVMKYELAKTKGG